MSLPVALNMVSLISEIGFVGLYLNTTIKYFFGLFYLPVLSDDRWKCLLLFSILWLYIIIQFLFF